MMEMCCLLLFILLLIDRTRSFSTTQSLRSTAFSFRSISPQQKWDHRLSTLFASESETDTDSIFDLIVLGGGVVGCQAALTAASSFGKHVALVDAPRASGMLLREVTTPVSTNNNGESGAGSSSSETITTVEDLSLGGPTGLFSKALRDTSKQIRVQSLRGMGLREDSVWNEIYNACVDLASFNSQDVQRQLDLAGVTYIQGHGQFPSSSATSSDVETDGDGTKNKPARRILQLNVELESGTSEQVNTSPPKKVLQAHNILVATGSKPFRPDGIPFDGKRLFDSDSINTLGYLPKSIAITGSGIIAIEFAKIFRNLGAEVTLIIRDQVPRNALMKIGLDKDVSSLLVADLVRSGIQIERGAQAKSFAVPSSTDGFRVPIKIELEARGGGPLPSGARTELKCDAYLAAVGRVPNTAGLNLPPDLQVDDYGGIVVDGRLETSVPQVFAAGDVVGRPFLASTGVAQGIAAIAAMFGTPEQDPIRRSDCDPTKDLNCLVDGGDVSSAGASFDPSSLASNPFAFPTGVWSSPEAAYYGLSVQQAQDLGLDAGEAIALYSECLRGCVFSPNGLLKLVFEKEPVAVVDDGSRGTMRPGRILGVHICGDDACELIHYGMELVKARRTVDDLNQSLFSAVTYHEMYRIAAAAAFDEAGARKRRAAAGSALAARNRQQMSSAS